MAEREQRLVALLIAYLVTGMLFMLLPGTFLGVWNLISISSDHSGASLSPAWIQAHGHAQIFGWIGTFIIGIGYFSLTKMGAIPSFAVSRGWTSWALWTAGVTLRWIANVTLWHWRMLLPASAFAELAGFFVFFWTVSNHRSPGESSRVEARRVEARRAEAWMLLVIGSTVGFLAALTWNAVAAAYLAVRADSPAFPHALDQRFLVLATWGIPVLAIWGFNARWLPAFLGLRAPAPKGLLAALGCCAAGVAAVAAGNFQIGSALLTIASLVIIAALNIFEPAEKPPNLQGVHPSFGVFIRLCYVWLLVSALLTMWASQSDRNGGIWGASRHALTVGFLASMIFAIGARVLPPFAGGRRIFSPRLMLASCALLNLGCFLRVLCEIPAYEGYSQAAWNVLPVSAMVEMAAVLLFAANLAATLLRPAKDIDDPRLYSISLKGMKAI
jgi:hypothetical protein